jgi:radical SAM superfamily enzyme YgiQ (UPF0313 family)
MLSSYLKNEGHETSMVFLKRPGFPYTNYHEKFYAVAQDIREYDWVGVDLSMNSFRYSRGPSVTEAEKQLLLQRIEEFRPHIIGFSITAPLMHRIADITKFVKDHFDVPVIWGGAGATTSPEDCAPHCDFVCVGEGELVLSEVARRLDRKESVHDVHGLCWRSNGKIVKNSLYPLLQDLNDLPFPDIHPEGKFLIEEDSLTEDFGEISYSDRYHVMGSRGCRFRCSYCSESYYKELYAPQCFLRRRSPESIITELKTARDTVGLQTIQFEDEIFCLEYDWLKTFCDLYKKEIGLPFNCYIYPVKNNERQLELLKEAGAFDVCLSLQSGSETINRLVFQRPYSKDLYVRTAKAIHSLGITFYTDVITYNPFETEDDLRATLDVLMEIPRPVAVFVNKLHILKNTALARLIESGKLKDRMNKTPTEVFDKYVRLFFKSFTDER